MGLRRRVVREHKEGYRTYCHPDYFKPIAPLVYHNEGNGHFTEVSQKIGLAKPGRVGHRVPSAAPDGRDAKGPAQISGATGFSGHRADIPSDGSPSRP
jgi:hypothetical protein